MNRLAIAILSLRRYYYLDVCLQSFQRAADLESADFLLFQDGAMNPRSGIRYARADEVQACVDVFVESNLPNKSVIRSEENIGINIGFYRMATESFGRGYDTVVLIPNDTIAGKYFITTVLALTEQFGQDRKAGVFETKTWDHARAEVTYANMLALEDKAAYGMPNLHGARLVHGAWRWCYDIVRHRLDCYYEKARHYDSNLLLRCSDRHQPEELLPIVRDIWKNCGTTVSGEHLLTSAARLHGMQGIHTLAPRAHHMGGVPYYASHGPGQRPALEKYPLWDFGGGVDRYEIVPDDWGPLGFGEELGCRR